MVEHALNAVETTFTISTLALVEIKIVRVHLPLLVPMMLSLLEDIILTKTITLQKIEGVTSKYCEHCVCHLTNKKIFWNKTYMSCQHCVTRTNITADPDSGEGPAQSETPTETPGVSITPMKEYFDPSN